MRNPFRKEVDNEEYVVLIDFNAGLVVKHLTRYVGRKIGGSRKPVPTNIHNAIRFTSEKEAKEVAALFNDPRYTASAVTLESQLKR